ncbi:MAG: hypothetical protein IKI50_02190 [Clostridia bacterium]|nr:hypothetical protein [Clostridia bacterium]
MKRNRNHLTAWLSAVILTAALLALPVYVPAAAEDVVFTQQPQSGVVNIGQPYTFTFETNRPCECMLQMREGSTYDWGNMEIVTSPYTIPDHPFEATFEYRLIVDEEEKTYYSDVFTVQWKRAENETTLYIEDGTFSDLPLGYGAVEAVPLAVTNTGAYATENLRAYLAEDSSLELIENRTPQAIPAGQTDHETWSVRPRQGLGVGYYQDSVFFAADNVEITTVFYPFTVVESDAEIVYEAQADPIDFGTLPVGYGEQEMIDLTVRATGTGNLSHVHLQLGEGADRFFSLQAQNASLDTLHAGQSTGSNWSLRLNSGLKAGTYQ